ncbi:histone deacetylase [Singulisphaera sp. PoT]|uniref:histone deacetylase family protein n=1 Tax=Singulisphaera sp. PoT TaxID=3411797 RepID=UPI003BF618B4
MLSLYTDERMLEHVPPPPHPERPERLQAILRQLDRSGVRKACNPGLVREAKREELLRVHDAAYVDRLALYTAKGGGLIEEDTWVCPKSNLAAHLAAGAAAEAVSEVLIHEGHRAFCAIRPPGHHARPAEPMGFCFYDNVAVAAAHAVAKFDVNRILIVDFDVHHGNGTQEIFYADPRVAFFSIHRSPFYPGSGSKNETGTGAGLGFTKNLPIRFGVSRKEYLAAYRAGLEAFADHIRPELVLISAGFDAHAEDPVGSLGLETEDFDPMTQLVVEIAETHAQGRIVSLLEGGYNVSRLAGCVDLHLKTLGATPET